MLMVLCAIGSELDSFISNLGWKMDGGVVTVPANPDNQIESTVVHEAIKLPRSLPFLSSLCFTNLSLHRTR